MCGGGPFWQLLTKPLDVNQDNMGWTVGGGVTWILNGYPLPYQRSTNIKS